MCYILRYTKLYQVAQLEQRDRATLAKMCRVGELKMGHFDAKF